MGEVMLNYGVEKWKNGKSLEGKTRSSRQDNRLK